MLQPSEWTRRKIMSAMLRISARTKRQELVAKLLDVSARLRRAELNRELLQGADALVQSGPFSGMRLSLEASWSDGAVAPKVLGSYEAELHPALCKAIVRRPATVVNIGCAEGYYAVGLALRLPNAKVIAFDSDERAQAVCRQMAAANAVADRVEVTGGCTPELLGAVMADRGRMLLVMDCEGGELELLSDDLIAGMRNCDVIVECHDFINRGSTEALMGRFAASHQVERVEERARDPNQFPLLQNRSSLECWLALCEFRPKLISWLACWAYGTE
jgi:hypothetical protein